MGEIESGYYDKGQIIGLINQAKREAYDDCPRQMHIAFCNKLVKIAKEHPGKPGKDIPEFMKALNAIEFLEEIYPQLKTD